MMMLLVVETDNSLNNRGLPINFPCAMAANVGFHGDAEKYFVSWEAYLQNMERLWS
jgi:hypothetical protein